MSTPRRSRRATKVKAAVDAVGVPWSQRELLSFYEALSTHRKDWDAVATELPGRSAAMVRAMYEMNQEYLLLPSSNADGFVSNVRVNFPTATADPLRDVASPLAGVDTLLAAAAVHGDSPARQYNGGGKQLSGFEKGSSRRVARALHSPGKRKRSSLATQMDLDDSADDDISVAASNASHRGKAPNGTRRRSSAAPSAAAAVVPSGARRSARSTAGKRKASTMRGYEYAGSTQDGSSSSGEEGLQDNGGNAAGGRRRASHARRSAGGRSTARAVTQGGRYSAMCNQDEDMMGMGDNGTGMGGDSGEEDGRSSRPSYARRRDFDNESTTTHDLLDAGDLDMHHDPSDPLRSPVGRRLAPTWGRAAAAFSGADIPVVEGVGRRTRAKRLARVYYGETDEHGTPIGAAARPHPPFSSTEGRYAYTVARTVGGRLRLFTLCEWTYSGIDRGFFLRNEFEEFLTSIQLPPDIRLARTEWNRIRDTVGPVRRTSRAFFRQEREKLRRYRQDVRAVQQGQLPLHSAEDGPFVYQVPAPLSVGQRVTCIHPDTRHLSQGKVLTVNVERGQYLIQFDHRDLGVQRCKDTDIVPHGPMHLLFGALTPTAEVAPSGPCVRTHTPRDPWVMGVPRPPAPNDTSTPAEPTAANAVSMHAGVGPVPTALGGTEAPSASGLKLDTSGHTAVNNDPAAGDFVTPTNAQSSGKPGLGGTSGSITPTQAHFHHAASSSVHPDASGYAGIDAAAFAQQVQTQVRGAAVSLQAVQSERLDQIHLLIAVERLVQRKTDLLRRLEQMTSRGKALSRPHTASFRDSFTWLLVQLDNTNESLDSMVQSLQGSVQRVSTRHAEQGAREAAALLVQADSTVVAMVDPHTAQAGVAVKSGDGTDDAAAASNADGYTRLKPAAADAALKSEPTTVLLTDLRCKAQEVVQQATNTVLAECEARLSRASISQPTASSTSTSASSGASTVILGIASSTATSTTVPASAASAPSSTTISVSGPTAVAGAPSTQPAVIPVAAPTVASTVMPAGPRLPADSAGSSLASASATPSEAQATSLETAETLTAAAAEESAHAGDASTSPTVPISAHARITSSTALLLAARGIAETAKLRFSTQHRDQNDEGGGGGGGPPATGPTGGLPFASMAHASALLTRSLEVMKPVHARNMGYYNELEKVIQTLQRICNVTYS